MSRRDVRRWMATAALLASAFVLAPAAPARALDFQCIEPSRYKHLLPVFNDDPNVFFSYFGLPRGRLPDLETCRALHVSGTLAEGDAEALLDRIIQGKGWLAALHLSFEGSNLEEEARIAVIIRSFALKTRAIRSDVFGLRTGLRHPLGAAAADDRNERGGAATARGHLAALSWGPHLSDSGATCG